jgi:hypothetical protein
VHFAEEVAAATHRKNASFLDTLAASYVALGALSGAQTLPGATKALRVFFQARCGGI